MSDAISILYPKFENTSYRELSEVACHDLGIDFICQKLTAKESEQKLFMSVLSKMTNNPEVARFREEVFSDICHCPQMRKKMMDLLNRVQFLKDYSCLKTNFQQKAGIWDLLHRMDAINDYIKCVEGIREVLVTEDIHSAGLLALRDYVDEIYRDALFEEMKKDIAQLGADTSCLRSVTVGINLNERFEASSVGVISVNSRPFKSSGIVSNFADAMKLKNSLKDDTEWNGEMHYRLIEPDNSLLLGQIKVGSTLIDVPEQDGAEEVSHYMDKIMNQLLSLTVKKLRDVLSRYVTVTIVHITSLIPEFLYYIKFAELIEQMQSKGLKFCKAEVMSSAESLMQARGIYNMKLAFAAMNEPMEIVSNDLDFDAEHMVYILTGANRGGKTTITQAIGVLYVLAQGGIYVPGDAFSFVPVDCIYTHFPADEDKTMDLGRLGEECTRFKEIYEKSTKDSLLLLNETFSTTSFEEGYYIAKDCVQALLRKKARTIYNTHMHKLALNIEEMNRVAEKEAGCVKASSLIVEADGGNRSFHVVVAPPAGTSYAKDIARKYGVTYEMLTEEK